VEGEGKNRSVRFLVWRGDRIGPCTRSDVSEASAGFAGKVVCVCVRLR
jgi:hypothetical protein